MSFEMGAESIAHATAQRVGPGAYPRRVYAPHSVQYGGLGATGAFATMTTRMVTASPTVATAPWMQGLPGASNDSDKTRIAYAKRDHDLAVAGNATAYNNLKSQSVGSATSVGKAWYGAALNDVNRVRVASAPAPAPRPAAPAPAPTLAPPPPTITYVRPPMPVIVREATDMGLKVQQTANGEVVAVNSEGAVVSKPLPVPVSAVTDKTILPVNTVQAAAPPPPKTPGVFSILDRLTDAFIPSQGPPPGFTATTQTPTAPTGDTSAGFGNLLQNPLILAVAAFVGVMLITSSSGRR